MSKYINVFKTLPKELFRLNNGTAIRLRDKASKPGGSFDLFTKAGKVLPKALDASTYAAPNGASMRPNTPTQQNLVKGFKGASVTVYAVPAGTQLPANLILVHERKDHYSLQPAVEMSLDDLNSAITSFLQTHGMTLTKDEWLQKYPKPTETS